MEKNNNQEPADTNTQALPENLSQQQALHLLIQGVQFAQSKGVFSLLDAGLLDRAVRVFSAEPEKNTVGNVNTEASAEEVSEASAQETV